MCMYSMRINIDAYKCIYILFGRVEIMSIKWRRRCWRRRALSPITRRVASSQLQGERDNTSTAPPATWDTRGRPYGRELPSIPDDERYRIVHDGGGVSHVQQDKQLNSYLHINIRIY